MTTFSDLDLDPRLLRAVTDKGFENPTPIQEAAIPPLLAGRDVVGAARTGSGKTAAFGLPLLQRLSKPGDAPGALVLAPTRELALQVSDELRSLATHTQLRFVTIYGGAPYRPQLRSLKQGVDVVVGTPGRIIDHLDRGSLRLDALQVLVLDEADEMLRMGFIDDVERIISASPGNRQMLLFSATMPKQIRSIAETHLTDPVDVSVEDGGMTTSHIDQRFLTVPHRHKLDALVRVLLGEEREATLVFARTRRDCAEVAEKLTERGVPADALHGDLPQQARETVVSRLRSGLVDVVVATDVAARGIDIDTISHVVNLEIPSDAETYVHRIGRTGRAGRKGMAIALVTPAEQRRLFRFGRVLDQRFERMQVPTEAAIQEQKLDALAESMAKAIDTDSPSQIGEWVDELLKSGDWDARELAMAAVELLAEEQGIEWGEKSDDRPHWDRKPSKEPFDHRAQGGQGGQGGSKGGNRGKNKGRLPDQVEIFVPVGKRQGVRPGDLVGALANEAGLPSSRMGRISIFDRKSFVAVSRSDAQKVLQTVPRLCIRGSDVKLSLARPEPKR